MFAVIWEDLGNIGFNSKTTTSDCRILLVGVTGVLKIRKALHSGERGTFTVPSLRGGSPPPLQDGHWDLYFYHKYAQPARPITRLPGIPYHSTKSHRNGALCRLIWTSSLQMAANKNGHNGRSPGVAILLFARHDLCNSIFSQCPTEKIGGGKKGGQGPSWPFISSRDMPEFSFQGTPHAGPAHDSVRGHVGAHPTPLGATKERNMLDEEGEACPMPKTS